MKILNDDEQTDFMKEVEEMIRSKYEPKESDDIVANAKGDKKIARPRSMFA